MGTRIEAGHSGKGLSVAIVVSRFNPILTEALLMGAEQTLADEGVSEEQADVFWVPGAFEIPLAALQLAAHPARSEDNQQNC